MTSLRGFRSRSLLPRSRTRVPDWYGPDRQPIGPGTVLRTHRVDGCDMPVLNWALLRHRAAAVEAALASCADPTRTDDRLRNAFHAAVDPCVPNATAVRQCTELLDYARSGGYHLGALNAADLEGYTPLGRAAARGLTALVRRMIEAGANARLFGGAGRLPGGTECSPLLAAAVAGHRSTVAALLKAGASWDDFVYTANGGTTGAASAFLIHTLSADPNGGEARVAAAVAVATDMAKTGARLLSTVGNVLAFGNGHEGAQVVAALVRAGAVDVRAARPEEALEIWTHVLRAELRLAARWVGWEEAADWVRERPLVTLLTGVLDASGPLFWNVFSHLIRSRDADRGAPEAATVRAMVHACAAVVAAVGGEARAGAPEAADWAHFERVGCAGAVQEALDERDRDTLRAAGAPQEHTRRRDRRM